jgi:hypothetical protein
VLTAFIIIALMKKAVSTSEMLENFYQTAWHNIPEECHLQTNKSVSNKSQFDPFSEWLPSLIE